jgi:hypothetical protein
MQTANTPTQSSTFETFDLKKGQCIMRVKLNCGLAIALSLASSLARADSLELVNGSLIQGKFVGGTESEISFQVGSPVQKYSVPDKLCTRLLVSPLSS